jgi:mono/diheme cytochrome c family protein
VDTEVKSVLKNFFTSVSSVSSVVASFVLLCVLCALVSAQDKGWTIPDGAATEKTPLSQTPDVLKKGAALYNSFCAGCHGPKGLGDGPYVDRKDTANRPANLALSENLEGVVFYKIWNGRSAPKMPAFKRQLTRDDTWALVAYVISLRP